MLPTGKGKGKGNMYFCGKRRKVLQFTKIKEDSINVLPLNIPQEV